MRTDKQIPPEESATVQPDAATIQQKRGTLYYDTTALKLPRGVLEEKPAKRRIAGISPALLLIVILSIIFIIGIAVMISRMP